MWNCWFLSCVFAQNLVILSLYRLEWSRKCCSLSASPCWQKWHHLFSLGCQVRLRPPVSRLARLSSFSLNILHVLFSFWSLTAPRWYCCCHFVLSVQCYLALMFTLSFCWRCPTADALFFYLWLQVGQDCMKLMFSHFSPIFMPGNDLYYEAAKAISHC